MCSDDLLPQLPMSQQTGGLVSVDQQMGSIELGSIMDSVVKGGNDLRSKLPPFSDGVAPDLDQVVSTSNESVGTSPHLKSAIHRKEPVAEITANDMTGSDLHGVPNAA